MNKYTFRVDVIPEVPQIEERIKTALQGRVGVKNKLDIIFSKYAIAFEISEKKSKPHFQGIVYTDSKYETYKKFMEEQFPEWKGTRGKGSGSRRSFAVVTKDTYESYVFKDKDLRFIFGYSEEDIAAIPPWVKVTNVDRKVIEQNKVTWFMTMVDKVKSQGITYHSAGWEIAKAIIIVYNEHLKCEPNDFQIKCYAKSIQRHLVFEYSKDHNKPHLLDNYLEQRSRQIIGYEWVHVSEQK